MHRGLLLYKGVPARTGNTVPLVSSTFLKRNPRLAGHINTVFASQPLHKCIQHYASYDGLQLNKHTQVNKKARKCTHSQLVN